MRRLGRVICNLWCSGQHEARDKQPYVAVNQKPPSDGASVPNYLRVNINGDLKMWLRVKEV